MTELHLSNGCAGGTMTSFSSKVAQYPLPKTGPDPFLRLDEAQWQTPKKYSPSKIRQYRQLGRLDPALYLNAETDDLYELPSGHLGRLWFALNYRPETEKLTVTLLKARNLRPHRELGSSQPTDCYLKINLDQDERRIHTTSVKKKSLNPNFNESFCLQIALDELPSQVLHLTVFDINRHKRHHVIGCAVFKLNALEQFNKDIRFFRDLETDNNIRIANTPELMVTLTHYPSQQRLTIGIFECKNLPVKEDHTLAEVYVKVGLHFGLNGKELKSKKTAILSSKKAFNESFSFNHISDLDRTNIRLTLVHHNSTLRFFDKPLGFIVLGSEMFARRKELEHWREMMERPEEQVSYWHQIQYY